MKHVERKLFVLCEFKKNFQNSKMPKSEQFHMNVNFCFCQTLFVMVHRSDKQNKIEAVRNIIARNPKNSVRKCSQEIGISKTQVQRILASDLEA